MKSRKCSLALAALFTFSPLASVQAQAWPSKPIQMIIPQGAGGSTDAIARLVAQSLGERLAQTVIADNRAGAGGTLGVVAAARAPADGHSLLIGSNTTMAANAFLYANFPVDPLKDFVPLALAADASFVFVVPANSPYKTLKEFVSAAKARPGKLSYGSGTSSAQLCTELLKASAGIDVLRVPYKSSAQSLTDLMGGQLDLVCEPLSSSQPNIRAGRLHALAQTGIRRSPLEPELETAVEAGVKGMEYTAWVAFYAPAGVPKDIAGQLGRELLAILKDPAIGAKIRAIGFEPRPADGEALHVLHRAEMSSVAATVKAAGIKPE
jgi:tripartite-type tricarboxylate transporter receptor subunit TctC